MSASRNVVPALIMVTTAMTAASQVPQTAASRAQSQVPAVSTSSIQSQVASPPIASPAADASSIAAATPLAAAARLGQQRRQSFERTRVLANPTGTVNVPPELQCGNVVAQHPSDGAMSALPGFGTQAGQTGPYVEEHFADGVVLYRFSSGTAVAPPNSSAYYCAYQVATIEVPKASPPAIPADNSQQAMWARYHNSQLRGVISRLVDDEPTMIKIDKAAADVSGGDLFKTTDFLTGVADFYAGNAP